MSMVKKFRSFKKAWNERNKMRTKDNFTFIEKANNNFYVVVIDPYEKRLFAREIINDALRNPFSERRLINVIRENKLPQAKARRLKEIINAW